MKYLILFTQAAAASDRRCEAVRQELALVRCTSSASPRAALREWRWVGMLRRWRLKARRRAADGGRGADDSTRAAATEQQRVLLFAEGGSAVDGRVMRFPAQKAAHRDGDVMLGLDLQVIVVRRKRTGAAAMRRSVLARVQRFTQAER